MQIPNVFPVRRADLVTDEADALSVAQPERRREYVRIRPGRFRGAFTETSDGKVAVLHERWSSALRVRCARPRSYVAFGVVASRKETRWCGLQLGPRNVLEFGCDWEMTTSGALEALAFGVERSALERVEALLAGDGAARPVGNRLLAGATANAEKLAHRITSALLASELPHTARQALDAEFLYLAARLRRPVAGAPARLESWSKRRAVVRRIEEFLDAHEREIPSLAELCAFAGIGERTLEYAFREQLGVPPGRFLRLRRLNAARRELRSAEPGTTRVTDVALRWGFWQLGRFATEYRTLFGERPSETLLVRR